jgi:hypothetical protein
MRAIITNFTLDTYMPNQDVEIVPPQELKELLIITPLGSLLSPPRQETPELSFLDISYQGFSKGMGEFMLKTLEHPLYRQQISQHKWIAFMGDDLEYDPKELLHASTHIKEPWWQPGHRPGSHHTFPRMASRYAPIKLPFIELNSVYSQEFLLKLQPYMHLSKSGWGVDVLFGKLQSDWYPQTPQPLVTNLVSMKHLKPVTGGWSIDGVSSGDEMNHIFHTYGIGIDWNVM